MTHTPTEAQLKALEAMPFRITMWGGKPFAGMPNGVKSIATLRALRSKGLASVRYSGTAEHWDITDAGRAALASHKTGG